LLSVIGIIVVGARLYARFFITKAPGIDDLLIVLAVVFALALSVLVMIGNQIYYNGYHVWVSTRFLLRPRLLLSNLRPGHTAVELCATSYQRLGCTGLLHTCSFLHQNQHIALLSPLERLVYSQILNRRLDWHYLQYMLLYRIHTASMSPVPTSLSLLE
jgi:hypothetical protein